MRAGSLSDPRVVALLRRHFLCVHIPELQTEDLIEDRRDVALLRHLDATLANTKPMTFGVQTPRLQAGEREVFLTPDGTIVDIFLSLNAGGQGQKQYTESVRAAPEAAVERFFAGAAKVLKATFGELPEDFAALQEGTAPAVAEVRGLKLPAPVGPAQGTALRIHTRSNFVMYEALTGSETVLLQPSEVKGLFPSSPGTEVRWPTGIVHRLCRAMYPRGAGVVLEFAPDSITGDLCAAATHLEDGLVRGTLQGSYRLTAETEEERGRRASYRPFRSCEGPLTGDFLFDPRTGELLSLRLVSEGTTTFHHGGLKEGRHRIAVERLAPAPTPPAKKNPTVWR